MENWKIIAAAICITLLTFALIYCGPSLWGLTTAMVKSTAKWITLALKKVSARLPSIEQVTIELVVDKLLTVQAMLSKYAPPSLQVIYPRIGAAGMPMQQHLCHSGAKIVLGYDFLDEMAKVMKVYIGISKYHINTL